MGLLYLVALISASRRRVTLVARRNALRLAHAREGLDDKFHIIREKRLSSCPHMKIAGKKLLLKNCQMMVLVLPCKVDGVCATVKVDGDRAAVKVDGDRAAVKVDGA